MTKPVLLSLTLLTAFAFNVFSLQPMMSNAIVNESESKPKSELAENIQITSSIPLKQTKEDWKKILFDDLPLLGHRNWIVVADSAYPLQTAPGIKTIYAGGDQIETVKHVLDTIKKARHVQGIVHVDKELDFVPEKHANGITDFRTQLTKVLGDQTNKKLEHEEIIKQLDEAGQTFRVLLIKTDLTLPYTSVFIRLDAGYWSDEAEKALRDALSKSR